jgi:hypothetical protein
MRYFKNYIDDAVIREDDNGNRYVKICDVHTPIFQLTESLADKQSKIAYGGEGFGIFHELTEITKEQYNSFGTSWYFGKSEDDIIYK